MRVHLVARANGYSAYLQVVGYGATPSARVCVVRDADGVVILAPTFLAHPRGTVVQWAYELGHATVNELLPRTRLA